MLRLIFNHEIPGRTPIDFEDTIVEYEFDAAMVVRFADRIQFEEEDSNFAPGPSVACRLQTDDGLEFALIHLQYCDKLLVYGQSDASSDLLRYVFTSEFPELSDSRFFRRRA